MFVVGMQDMFASDNMEPHMQQMMDHQQYNEYGNDEYDYREREEYVERRPREVDVDMGRYERYDKREVERRSRGDRYERYERKVSSGNMDRRRERERDRFEEDWERGSRQVRDRKRSVERYERRRRSRSRSGDRERRNVRRRYE
eukprot:TRINITY_DN12457_c0_g1_i1.p2 TRINITY_DN12457_c0_g1~~TRINITY_DN12457_c0_g1_i1.p2  ORF type:complete len:144 (-),score=13.38 TRINITY_DN12457_c0_g1_i1:254-685(-)